MNTEFTIFRVKKGKEKRAKEWMRQLASRRAECVENYNTIACVFLQSGR